MPLSVWITIMIMIRILIKTIIKILKIMKILKFRIISWARMSKIQSMVNQR